MSNVFIQLGNLVERLGAFVRGCPPDFLFDELCCAAREVCAETSIWKEEVLARVREGESSVFIDGFLPTGSAPLGARTVDTHTLLSASVGGRRLRILLQDAAEWLRTDSSLPGSGEITAVAMRDADTIDVFPAPAADTTLVLHFACVPRRDPQAWVPEHVFVAAYDAFKHATLARLFAVAETPWTNESLAMHHARQAVLAKAKLRVRDKTGAVAGSVMTKMQPFGA